MQKWEYLTVYLVKENGIWRTGSVNDKIIPSDDREKMYSYISQKGDEGWELVSVTNTTQTLETKGTSFYHDTTKYTEWYRMFFKRPKD